MVYSSCIRWLVLKPSVKLFIRGYVHLYKAATIKIFDEVYLLHINGYRWLVFRRLVKYICVIFMTYLRVYKADSIHTINGCSEQSLIACVSNGVCQPAIAPGDAALPIRHACLVSSRKTYLE